MPSRIIHDILEHILETSDVVEVRNQEPRREYSDDGFHRIYMGHFSPTIRLRKIIKFGEIENLPVSVYNELISILRSLVEHGAPVDISRKFKGVRVDRLESMVNDSTHTTDMIVEFVVDDLDEDRWRNMSRGSRRSAVMYDVPTGIHPVYEKEYKQIWKKKPKKHFEDDLFRV